MAGAAGGAPVDPYLASTVLLLRMEGSEGGTVFTDSSALARTVTASGTLWVTSSEQAKSGTRSMKCDGSSGGVTVPETAATELTGDFTIECWFYPTGIPSSTGQAVWGWYRNSSTNTLCPLFWNDGKIYMNDGGDKTAGTTLTLNAWHHLAMTRTGSTIRFWVDGVQSGVTYTSAATYGVSGQVSYIGLKTSVTYLLGITSTAQYIDLFRVTRADRYGSTSFTPATDY